VTDDVLLVRGGAREAALERSSSPASSSMTLLIFVDASLIVYGVSSSAVR